jgi:glycosyltransferase involved in cell wall biosynthesis
MRHITFVTNEIYPLTKGGIGVLLNNLTQALNKDPEIRISVIIWGTEETKFDLLPDGYSDKDRIRFYSLDEILSKAPAYREIPLWAFHFEEYYISYKICNALLCLNDLEPIDIIEFNDYLGLGYVTCKFKKLFRNNPFDNTRIGVRIHGSSEICQMADEDNLFTKRKQVIHHMERYSLANCDFWIAPSKSLFSHYSAFYGITRPYYVSIPPFTKMGEGNKHPRTLSKTGPKIIFYGKLQKLKGIEEFIKAGIKLLGRTNIPFQFEIFGHEVNHHSHSYTDQLKKLIPEKFQANFNFRGRISIDSLEKIARDCEVAVIPSRFETFCLAAHELNWLGIPLVLNRIDAFKDYFSEENCWYFDEKQPLDQVLATIYSEKEKKLLKWNGAEMNHRIQENSSVKLYHSIITDKPSVPEAKPETPLVSIVVPYYNMEKYINATLDSILNSTYRNYEVIVIDDGSNNQRSVSKFKNLSKEYPASTFQFLSKENGGLGSARNFGIRQAKGKYILPLDSDDIIHHQYLELAVNALEKNPSLTAVNSFVNFFLDGTRPDETIDYVIPYDLVIL